MTSSKIMTLESETSSGPSKIQLFCVDSQIMCNVQLTELAEHLNPCSTGTGCKEAALEMIVAFVCR